MVEKTRVISKQIDETGVTIVVKGVGSLRVNYANLSRAVKDRGLAHGIVQRVCDAAALSRNLVGGKELNATPEAKFQAMKEIVDHLNSGTESWSLARESEPAFVGLLVQALCELYPESTEERNRKWALKLSAADRKALLASEKLKAIADRIESARLKHIDTEELLSDLELFDDSED